MGDGTRTSRLAPVRIGTATDWTSVSAGDGYALGLKADGSLWGWGRNSDGQLGDGTTTERLVPTRIGASTDWASISAGDRYAVGIKIDGSLWAWGFNSHGQVGDGTKSPRSTPVEIGTTHDWAAAATDFYHSLALKSDGSLWAWGGNVYGALGDGTTTERLVPTRIGSAADWATVSSGIHSLALKSDGSLWAWGWNSSGQLGDGTATDRWVPARTGGANDWTSLSSAENHSSALKSDGSLWGWGYNLWGYLGDGTTSERRIPTRVGGGNDWVAVNVGRYHTLAQKSDGSLWACGFNGYGALGDGTTTHSSTFVPVRFPAPTPDPGVWDAKLAKPAVVLINGWLNKDDGEMGKLRPLLMAEVRAGRISSVSLVPSRVNATPEQGIDSVGNLDEQIDRFANWLADDAQANLRDRPIIIIGHSYGGVISRGLVSTGSRARIAKTALKDHMGILGNIKGVIQLGSPNEGSALAQALNDPGCDPELWVAVGAGKLGILEQKPSKATKSMAPSAMASWNKAHAVASVPIQRAAGLYTPAALDECITFTKSGEAWPGNIYVYNLAPDPAPVVTAYHALEKLHNTLGRQASDGSVTQRSAVSDDKYFKGGGWITFPHLSHAAGVPGDRLVEEQYPRFGSIFDGPARVRDMHTHKHVVPSDAQNAVLDDILWAIANPGKRWGNGPDRDRVPAAMASGRRVTAVTAEDPGTLAMLPRKLSVPAAGTSDFVLPLDVDPITMTLASSVATPVLVSIGDAGSVDTTIASYRLEGGPFITRVAALARSAGSRTVRVGLGGEGGDVTVSASAGSGPRLLLEVVSDVRAIGKPLRLETRVTSGGSPVPGVDVRVEVGTEAERSEVEMRDDGIGPDSAPGDGTFTGETVPAGTPGDWYATAEACSATLDRYARADFSVGSAAWARIAGAAEETSVPGAAGTIGRWGVAVPVIADTSGTYGVSCDVVDGDGRLVVQPSAAVELASAEETTVVSWVGGEALARVASGTLRIMTVRLDRTDAGAASTIDEASGPVTRAYTPDDFESFSLDLDRGFSVPTSATTVFTGRARCTTSGVGSVEYSLDGGSVWLPVSADDGAFDGPSEAFTIGLDLGEGLHGLLVRSRSSEGVELPRTEWGAERFVVDRTAPGAVGAVGVMPELADRTSVVATWSPVEEATSDVAAVVYEVSLDLGSPLKTTEASCPLSLPDLASHVIRVRAVDAAGNTGPWSSVEVGDGTPPLTSVTGISVARGSSEATLVATDADSGVAYTEWTEPGGASHLGTRISVSGAGTHTVEYASTDLAGNREATKTVEIQVLPPLALPRVEGPNRIDTSVKASQAAFDSADAVVIATAYNFPDALGGSSLAGALDAPLLLTNTASLPDSVIAEIRRLGAKKAYVLGSDKAVSVSVAARLAQLLDGSGNVVRIGGAGRYETAALIASETVSVLKADGRTFDGAVLVATGENFPDALAASPLAAAKARPILLTRATELPPATLDALAKLKVKQATVLGSPRAVSDGVETALASKVGSVGRLEGAGRYQTAIAVAKAAVDEGLTWDGVALATGTNYPDALAGGVMCGKLGSVMLLTDPLSLTPDVRGELVSHKDKIGTVRFLGSEKAVTPGVRSAVGEALNQP